MFPLLQMPRLGPNGGMAAVSMRGIHGHSHPDEADQSQSTNHTSCSRYFQDVYASRAIHRAVPSVAFTPFHVALTHGDVPFVRAVLDEMGSSELKSFVLSAIVDYSQDEGHISPEHSAERTAASRDTYKLQKYRWNYPLNNTDSVQKRQFLEELELECNGNLEDAMTLQLPLALAACSGSTELVSLMLEEGSSLHQTDPKGNNIIHSLVLLSEDFPTLAVDMYEFLLRQLVNDDHRRHLVLRKNEADFRPLELAASKCLAEMLEALIQTEGVYKFVYKDFGMFRHVLYDVSAYEGKDITNRKSCILRLLSCCTEKQLMHLDRCNLLSSEPFNTWFEEKYQAYKYAIHFNFGFWVVYICMYGFGLSNAMNKTELPSTWIMGLLLLLGTAIIISEVTVAIAKWRNGDVTLCSPQELFRDSAIRGSRYRVFHTVFAVFTSITAIIQLSVSLHCYSKAHFTLVLHVINIFSGMMAVFFFSQLSIKTGHYITIIEKMASDTWVFMTMMLWVFVSFSLSFYIVHQEPQCEHAEHPNRSDSRVTFTDFPHGLYETLILTLGIAAPRSLFFEEAYFPLLAIFIYICGILWIGIIMMNLLIAIMNQRVIEITAHKRTVLTLQKLSISIYIEDFLDRYISTLTLVQWLCRGRLVRKRKSYVYSPDGSMVFLRTVEKVASPGDCRGTTV